MATGADTMSSLSSDATSFIPGYGIFQQVLLQHFGVEANELVSKYLILFAIYKFVDWFHDKAHDFLVNHFTSAIEIDDYDALWNQLNDWARTQPMTKVGRDIRAVSTTSESTHDPEDDDDDEETNPNEAGDSNDDYALGPTGLFSFDAWNRKNPLKYFPNSKKSFITHNGHYFQWKISARKNINGNGEDRLIIIRCLGRSTKPIKDFLEYIKVWTHEKQAVKPTHVYHATCSTDSGGTYWSRVATRPSRPLSTVALDDEQKGMIVRDINDYLQPATARWYAARGIPHRRGYLFHGPPGTGKTTLSFSLAGLFGLAIYCVALGETGLTEARLGTLFAALPERCIVLLEDIDSAGLRRDGGKDVGDSSGQDDSDSSGDEGEQAGSSNPTAVIQERRETKNVSGELSKPHGLISLAGLLNVIDGAASKEGRVLIMTTNHREKLDPALIRPGRVDLQIGFTLATKAQARDIFKRMYNTDLDVKREQTQSGQSAIPATTDTLSASAEDRAFLQLCLHSPTSSTIPPAQLDELADKFASSIPSKVFSPAEIQDYLLKKKTDPLSAVSEAEKWRDEHLDEKKRRKEKEKERGKKDGHSEAKKEDRGVAKKRWEMWKRE